MRIRVLARGLGEHVGVAALRRSVPGLAAVVVAARRRLACLLLQPPRRAVPCAEHLGCGGGEVVGCRPGRGDDRERKAWHAQWRGLARRRAVAGILRGQHRRDSSARHPGDQHARCHAGVPHDKQPHDRPRDVLAMCACGGRGVGRGGDVGLGEGHRRGVPRQGGECDPRPLRGGAPDRLRRAQRRVHHRRGAVSRPQAHGGLRAGSAGGCWHRHRCEALGAEPARDRQKEGECLRILAGSVGGVLPAV
mmetsp:Transcript_15925/g.46026  ORF Transcript_15925/g.46026 Transcript_15925/m.46026 type:complete len:249 (-) Transcript_15925:1626-2372(-)